MAITTRRVLKYTIGLLPLIFLSVVILLGNFVQWLMEGEQEIFTVHDLKELWKK